MFHFPTSGQEVLWPRVLGSELLQLREGSYLAQQGFKALMQSFAPGSSSARESGKVSSVSGVGMK